MPSVRSGRYSPGPIIGSSSGQIGCFSTAAPLEKVKRNPTSLLQSPTKRRHSMTRPNLFGDLPQQLPEELVTTLPAHQGARYDDFPESRTARLPPAQGSYACCNGDSEAHLPRV